MPYAILSRFQSSYYVLLSLRQSQYIAAAWKLALTETAKKKKTNARHAPWSDFVRLHGSLNIQKAKTQARLLGNINI
jgi:hypothetical protein